MSQPSFMDYETCEPLRAWGRLEPRPRQVDFDQALAANVHDPLWMLSRQWQIGEFQGEDTGSAIVAKLARRLTPVADHLLGSSTAAEAEDHTLPAETRVERLPIDFAPIVRAQIGRTFLLHAEEAAQAAQRRSPLATPFAAADLRAALLADYGIEPAPVPSVGDFVGQARGRIAARAGRMTAALAGRALDGVRLVASLSAAGSGALPREVLVATSPDHAALLIDASERFCSWFRELYPSAASAWDPAALEYQAVARMPTDGGDLRLSLREYASGDLDWWSYDQQSLTPGGSSLTTTDVRSVIPAPASFAGMPNPRWWQFEDAAVDLGNFRAQATDLARIVVAEFALVYGNNWFVIPVAQPVGTLAEIEGVVVTDVFGERTLIGPAVTGSSGSWASWDLFSVSPRDPLKASSLGEHLFLPATLSHAIDAEPHETVTLVRDEVANMVWGVVRRVADGLGGSEDGIEAARRLSVALESLVAAGKQESEAALPALPAAPPAEPAEVRYRLGTEVSEAWIPFVPVHVAGSTRSIQLQRGAMPRVAMPPVIEPSAPKPDLVRPRTSVLRHGIDETTGKVTLPYFVHEEEVPRTGVTVSGTLRRARWLGGRTVIWHGRTVFPGRGEADAGLRFDVVEPVEVK